MKHKDGKLINPPNKHRSLTAAITIIVLCGFSFYLGGIFKSGNSDNGVSVINNIQKTLESPKESSGSLQIRSFNFPECSNDYQDYTPCTDPKVLILIILVMLWFFVEENFIVMLIEYICMIFVEMEKVWYL